MRTGQSGKNSASSSLITAAGIVKKCSVIGTGDHVEIWAEERWEAYNQDSEESLEAAAETLTEFLI